MTVRALIADDEALARAKLRELLVGVSWIECVGETAHGEETLAAIDSLKPDLVFLDVQMPGPSGIDVLSRARHRPAVIFTTAFDRYAVTAFEIGALDYLLKPFGRERVHAVLARARTAIEHGMPAVAARANVLSPSRPLSHVFVKERGRMLAVPLDRVERLEACDDYVALYADGRRHLLHARLQDLAARLEPSRFVRVHRSHVVNLSFVAAIEPRDGSRLTILLTSGARVPASRAGSAQIKSARIS